MPRNPLRRMLRMDEVGQVPSGIEFNEAIPESIEKQREANVLSGMDARADASIGRDLEMANAVRDARTMGFEGMNPLREQADYSAAQKLQMVLAPLLAKMQTEQQDRAFESGQNALNRDAAMQRATLSQSGMDRRAAERQAAAVAMAKATGRIPEPGWLESLFGGEEADPEAAPAAPAGPSKYRIVSR